MGFYEYFGNHAGIGLGLLGLPLPEEEKLKGR